MPCHQNPTLAGVCVPVGYGVFVLGGIFLLRGFCGRCFSSAPTQEKGSACASRSHRRWCAGMGGVLEPQLSQNQSALSLTWS